VLKIFPLGDACAQPRRHLGFWDPRHISGSNSERKLKFGTELILIAALT